MGNVINSVNKLLIRTTAVKLALSERLVETIVNYQFQSTNEAMGINNSVELSGFGKFLFNNTRAKKRLKSLEKTVSILGDPTNPQTMSKSPVFVERVLEDTKKHIAHLKPKIKND